MDRLRDAYIHVDGIGGFQHRIYLMSSIGHVNISCQKTSAIYMHYYVGLIPMQIFVHFMNACPREYTLLQYSFHRMEVGVLVPLLRRYDCIKTASRVP